MTVDHNRINELQRAIADAQREKVERVQNDPDKRIEAAAAELRALNEQQRQAQFENDLATNRRLVEANAAAIGQLAPALDTILTPLLSSTAVQVQVDETFRIQQSHVQNALANVMAAYNTPEFIRRLNSTDWREQEAARQENSLAYQNAEAQFTDAAPLALALVQWIHDAPDSQQRRLRQAVGFAITGVLYDPTPDFNLQTEAGRLTAVERRRYFRGN